MSTVISITGKKYVDLGEKIELTCNASGGKVIPVEIDWFKGGDKIDTGEEQYQHVLMVKSQFMASKSFISTLIINHSKLSDSGNYICRSSRNDIANLMVTVLHETNPGPLARDRQTEQEYKNKSASSAHVPIQTSLLTITLCVLLTLLRLSGFSSFSSSFSVFNL
ncbi:protein CEPU-1 [Elysia marginata]|uniref:Protein CEPU-1 n=1 Tax=Elysia marginata TaxID=1093978 RepID=A0AAV4HWU5_9GAST|nr:protein CEPU-1 [Elysia marginata]